ncbi:helix-turn-helix transcriptional regulator [uncultured Tolumonas sp.]|uniref:helix-turn-helix domain-containing protein n=1 Tax=uncultured Tolumonas sp. TaxID=263765 RepID=UPI002A0A72A8|nr:helix-turn-helix transcriptional regulator [uncultured Tolumonas sp.]
MLQGMPEIGAQYAEQRKAKGGTQADAATRVNLARPVISMIERGRFTGSLKSLVAYLSVLG